MGAEGGGGIAVDRMRDPAMAQRGKARVSRPVGGIRRPVDAQLILDLDRHLAAQAIEGESLGERLDLCCFAVDQHIMLVRPQDEVEQHLALRTEQCAIARLIRSEGQDVLGDQPLQKGACFLAR